LYLPAGRQAPTEGEQMPAKSQFQTELEARDVDYENFMEKINQSGYEFPALSLQDFFAKLQNEKHREPKEGTIYRQSFKLTLTVKNGPFADIALGELYQNNNKLVIALANEYVRQALLVLNKSLAGEKATKILVYRFGLDGNEPWSQSKVGKIYGISGSRLSYIEATIFSRIRGGVVERKLTQKKNIATTKNVAHLPINSLNFTLSLLASLSSYRTIGQLCKASPIELVDKRGFGSGSLRRVLEALVELGLNLRPVPREDFRVMHAALRREVLKVCDSCDYEFLEE
jgi:hypothetical protein